MKDVPVLHPVGSGAGRPKPATKREPRTMAGLWRVLTGLLACFLGFRWLWLYGGRSLAGRTADASFVQLSAAAAASAFLFVLLVCLGRRAARLAGAGEAKPEREEARNVDDAIPMDKSAFPAPRRLAPAPAPETTVDAFPVPLRGHHDVLPGVHGAERLLSTVPPDRDGVWICTHGQSVRLLLVVKGRILDLGGDTPVENAETEAVLRRDAWWSGPFDVLALARALNGRQAFEMFVRFQDA